MRIAIRSLFAGSLFVGLLSLTVARPVLAANTINVTNQGATAYLFNGGFPNGPLTLVRGQTYTFNVTATGHPFHITTAPGLPAQDFVDPGLTGNGTASGTITFTVPTANPPTQLFFQCGIHTAMTGTINLVAAAPSVPATGMVGLVVLALAALAVGFALLRRRAS